MLYAGFPQIITGHFHWVGKTNKLQEIIEDNTLGFTPFINGYCHQDWDMDK